MESTEPDDSRFQHGLLHESTLLSQLINLKMRKPKTGSAKFKAWQQEVFLKAELEPVSRDNAEVDPGKVGRPKARLSDQPKKRTSIKRHVSGK